MDKAAALAAVHKKWIAECSCGLRQTATQAVPGYGNANAPVVFIGEAPGKKEDREGRPFIGAAGKFRDEMLQSINMKRDDIYITNVVKYRPPNNRDPLLEEKEACREWLQDELMTIQPQLIVFLGRHAMSNFFPNEKISAVNGKLLKKKIPDFPTEYFLPLYHPAAALYNGGLRQELLKDFQRIRLFLLSKHS